MKHFISSILMGGILALMFMHAPAQAQVVVPGVFQRPGGVPGNPAAMQWARGSSVGFIYGKVKGTYEPVGAPAGDAEFNLTGLQGQMVGDTFSLGLGQTSLKYSENDPDENFDLDGKILDLGGSMLLTENLSIGVGREKSDLTVTSKDKNTLDYVKGTIEETYTRAGGTFRLGENLYLGAAMGEENKVLNIDFYNAADVYGGSFSYDATRSVQMIGVAYSNLGGSDSGFYFEVSQETAKPYEFTDGSSEEEYKEMVVAVEALYSNYFAGIQIKNDTSTDYNPAGPFTEVTDTKETLITFGYSPADGFGVALGHTSETEEETVSGVVTSTASSSGNFLSAYMNF